MTRTDKRPSRDVLREIRAGGKHENRLSSDNPKALRKRLYQVARRAGWWGYSFNVLENELIVYVVKE